jgi:hypothetical protein
MNTNILDMFSFDFQLSFCYLTMTSASRLHAVGDRMINECGTVGAIRIGRETEVLEEKLPHCHH